MYTKQYADLEVKILDINEREQLRTLLNKTNQRYKARLKGIVYSLPFFDEHDAGDLIDSMWRLVIKPITSSDSDKEEKAENGLRYLEEDVTYVFNDMQKRVPHWFELPYVRADFSFKFLKGLLPIIQEVYENRKKDLGKAVGIGKRIEKIYDDLNAIITSAITDYDVFAKEKELFVRAYETQMKFLQTSILKNRSGWLFDWNYYLIGGYPHDRSEDRTAKRMVEIMIHLEPSKFLDENTLKLLQDSFDTEDIKKIPKDELTQAVQMYKIFREGMIKAAKQFEDLLTHDVFFGEEQIMHVFAQLAHCRASLLLLLDLDESQKLQVADVYNSLAMQYFLQRGSTEDAALDFTVKTKRMIDDLKKVYEPLLRIHQATPLP